MLHRNIKSLDKLETAEAREAQADKEQHIPPTPPNAKFVLVEEILPDFDDPSFLIILASYDPNNFC